MRSFAKQLLKNLGRKTSGQAATNNYNFNIFLELEFLKNMVFIFFDLIRATSPLAL
jgi:hypothetical protein